jgi:DNA invertase Pin-like site-specific DNA recombinase
MTGSEELSRSIDDRLGDIIHQIADARDAFASAAQHVSRTVDMRLEQVKARAGVRSAQFRKERNRVNSKVKRALANARQKLQRWKETGESEKLRRYADQAEQYALAALLNANEAIDNALIAAIESLEARLISDGATRKQRS